MNNRRSTVKAKSLLALFLSISMAIPLQPQASACTRLVYETGNGTFITGRTMDWMDPNAQTALWVFPRGMKRDGGVGMNPIKWTSKYGSISTSFYDIGTADGMIFSQHHDAPVAMPSAIRILSSVVTRRTRSGDILGAEQCIPVDAALKSITLWAAYQHFEEANRGSIEVGKLADFVVLDKNPHSIPIEELADLKVLQTIKEGKAIYTAP